MAKKAKRKQTKLKKTMLLTSIIFSLCISFTICALGGYGFTDLMYSEYEDYISSILRYVDYDIDNQDLAEAIEKQEWTPACQQLKDQLDQIKETFEIKYVYIIKPLNTNEFDNVLNIMEGETEEEKADGVIEFLYLSGNEYPKKVAEFYLNHFTESRDFAFFKNKTRYGSLFTGLCPIHDDNNKPVALLCVDIDMFDIDILILIFLVFVLVGSFLLTVLFIVFLYKWLKFRVIKPVVKIEKASRDFVKSAHTESDPSNIVFVNPNIKTGDEMEGLSNTISDMANDLKKYMVDLVKETADQERIRTELDLATTIQASSLPSIFPAFPHRKEFDLYALMDPAKEVGGDFYDFFLIDDDHLALTIADVSGKGVPAALFMMASQIMIKNQAMVPLAPKDILKSVNNQLCENNTAEMFVTTWIGILELSTGKIVAANAGHEFPAIKQGKEEFSLLKDKHGFVLGGMEGMSYKEYELQLQPGDSIFVYTDGVVEATNSQNELFGTDRMLQALNKKSNASPKELLQSVQEDVDQFVGNADQFDDLTMLCLTYHGKEQD